MLASTPIAVVRPDPFALMTRTHVQAGFERRGTRTKDRQLGVLAPRDRDPTVRRGLGGGCPVGTAGTTCARRPRDGESPRPLARWLLQVRR